MKRKRQKRIWSLWRGFESRILNIFLWKSEQMLMSYWVLIDARMSGSDTQYGHSQSEKKLGVGDKYHRSIKVHT